MSDPLQVTTLFDIEQNHTPAPGEVGKIESLNGDLYAINYWLAQAMSAGSLAGVWDGLSVGGRITQDPNAAQHLGPDVLTDLAITQISDVTVDDETAAVKAIHANQQTIMNNLNNIVAGINLRTQNYNILLQYLINYSSLKA
ncbi:hypothetical protein BS639_17265 [Rouxiella silvae]|uniref:Uncharacterized protein n=1 Tax=Rouxiella silvae TaxID=1646373 RepID=A0ABX3TXV6_9GAMM|nr:hypothetical protein [Rouxiella silvae]ORJ20043.1 hypothetical protein BS639_17265 [Rouxiella silvae]